MGIDPYFTDHWTTIYQGSCLDVLPLLPANSVHAVCTSPPYWGLRDYNTATWTGGDPACDHRAGLARQDAGNGRHNSSTFHGSMSTAHGGGVRYATGTCGRCGAVRHDQGIGNEASIEEYVDNLVQVFREVRRVLRDDGTCWINLGDTFASSSIRADVRHSLEGLMKGQPLVFGEAITIGITSHGGEVPLNDDRLPYGVLLSLFGIERVTVKQRENHFCQVFHTLARPSYCWIGVPVQYVTRNAAHLEIVIDSGYRPRIIISDHKSHCHSELEVLGSSCTGACKKRDRAFSIKEAAQPITEIIRDGETIGNPIAFNTPLKRFPDIYLVDGPIALQDGFVSSSGDQADFLVTQASPQQLTLALGNSGWDLTSTMVGHLYSLNAFGSFVHYTELYKRAIQRANILRPKQELGIPDLVKRALMEDGWICRSTIIWHKLNPMPESVTDRPTKAHEQVYLLTKSPKYFYDAAAVKEATSPASDFCRARPLIPMPSGTSDGTNDHRIHARLGNGSVGHPAGRNLRSVWSLASEPTPFAHFATFPSALVRRCLLASCSAGGVCAGCGTPYRRVVEHTYIPHPRGGYIGKKIEQHGNGVTPMAGMPRMDLKTTTIGFAPACACGPAAGVTSAVCLDPFAGAGTTMLTARDLFIRSIGVELNPAYCALAASRLQQGVLALQPGRC